MKMFDTFTNVVSQRKLLFRKGIKVATYTDGSTIDDRLFSGRIVMSIYALHTAKSFLNLEIRNPGMKMSKHGSALDFAENLSGLKFGRGVSGRMKAIEWAKNEIARIEVEERVV